MNYCERNVSNYFNVRDENDFIKDIEKLSLSHTIEEKSDGLGNTKFCVCTDDIFNYNEETDEEVGYDDLCEVIRKHLPYNQKVFLSTIGWEGYRYVSASCARILPYKIHYNDFFRDMSVDHNEGKDIFFGVIQSKNKL